MHEYIFDDETKTLNLKLQKIYEFKVRCYTTSKKFKTIINILEAAGFVCYFNDTGNEDVFITSIMVRTKDYILGYEISNIIPCGNHFVTIDRISLEKIEQLKVIGLDIIENHNNIINNDIDIYMRMNDIKDNVNSSISDIKLGQKVWFIVNNEYHCSTVKSIIESLNNETKYELTYLNINIYLERTELFLVEPKTTIENKVLKNIVGLANAIALAAEKFVDIYDKSGQPYILHCIQVMENVRKWGDVELEIAAILHDIIEDTDLTAFDLLDMGYSKRVVDIVSLVSFEKGCNYEARILEICNNQDAIKVKMADLEHNSMILRMKGISRKDLDRIEKYHRAYFVLAGHLEK